MHSGGELEHGRVCQSSPCIIAGSDGRACCLGYQALSCLQTRETSGHVLRTFVRDLILFRILCTYSAKSTRHSLCRVSTPWLTGLLCTPSTTPSSLPPPVKTWQRPLADRWTGCLGTVKLGAGFILRRRHISWKSFETSHASSPFFWRSWVMGFFWPHDLLLPLIP